MDNAARDARNAYRREWYRKNKDKAKAQQEKYWERKAQKINNAETDQNNQG